ncbi:hypothetical protein EZS27_034177, partial [termite gut metagenome]
MEFRILGENLRYFLPSLLANLIFAR